MDILHLVDRLEELLNRSRPIPFTHNVAVDEDRMLDIIDQMRIAVPDEVKKAQQLLGQKDRFQAQAQEEASRTIAMAREKSETLVERDSISQAAQTRADQIVEQANLEAEAVRQDADDYVTQTLTSLEMELDRVINQVRNGISTLQADQQARLGAPTPPPAQQGQGD